MRVAPDMGQSDSVARKAGPRGERRWEGGEGKGRGFGSKGKVTSFFQRERECWFGERVSEEGGEEGRSR